MGPFRDPLALDALVQQEGVGALLDRLDASLARDPDPALEALREAVARSAAILVDDPTQLPAQLVGRLAGLAFPPDAVADIGLLVERTRTFRGRSWLCPRSGTLTGPGAPLRRVLRGTPDAVTAVALSADGRLAVAGSYGRDVRIWDLAKGLLVAQFTGERPGPSYAEGAGGDAITAVRFDGDTVVAASADRCVYEVDRVTGAGKMVIQGETDNLFAGALSTDGKTFVAGPRDIWGPTDYCLQVWDVRRAKRTRTLDGPGQAVAHLALTPDGGRAAAASESGNVSIWDTVTGGTVSTSSPGPTSAIALSPDGTLVATGHADGRVLVRRTTDAAPVHELATGSGAVCALAFVDPSRLACGTVGGDLVVTNLAADGRVYRMPSQGSSVLAVEGTKDLETLVAGCGDGALRRWDVRASLSPTGVTGDTLDAASTAPVDASVRQRVEALETAQFGGDRFARHEVTGVAAAGRLALAASLHWEMVFYRLGITEEETHVRLWDTTSGEVLRELASTSRRLVHGGHVDTFRCVALSADGSLAGAGSNDRTFRLWATDDGRQVAAFTADSAVTSCSLSPDGTYATVTEASGREHVLDLIAGVVLERSAQAVRPFPERHDDRDAGSEQVEQRGPVVARGKKGTGRTIEKHLERFGAPVVRLSGTDGEELCLSALSVEGHEYQLTVSWLAGLGEVQFRVGGLLHATLDDTPADRIHGLLLALAVLNYRIPMGALGYDPRDGEVALRHAQPATGGDVGYDDFEQVLVVLQNVLAKHAGDLRAVVAGERTAQEILR